GRSVEDRPASASALPVPFVGRREVTGTDPSHRVGFTGRFRDGPTLIDGTVLDGVDSVDGDRTGAEDRSDLAAGTVDDRDAVVLLQCDRDRTVGIDVD